MTYASEVLADAPWGFWQLAETSGSTLADSSGNSRTMTITGAPTFAQPGPMASEPAILWPQNANPPTYYANTTATTNTGPVTAEAWVYLTSVPVNQTVIMGCANTFNGSTTDKILSITTAGKVSWMVFSGSALTTLSSAALSLNVWHHVVASTGAAGTKIRVDKVTVGTGTPTTSFTSSGQQVLLHAAGSGYSTSRDISIAAPAFYAAQLSDTRTDAHYDASGFTPPPAALSGVWGLVS